ncbi:MAG: hypothetical protein U0353_34915, partial [Sandaracinus sp.]
RSIVFDHDVDFANDYVTCPDPWGMAQMPHGAAMNQWSPGASIFFVPILLFDVITGHPALASDDPHIANACIGALPERAVRGSVFAGLLLLVISFLVARRVSDDGAAALAAVGSMVGGPIVYYATVMLSYGHAASGALSGLAVWAWIRERTRDAPPRTSGFVWMGLTLGLAMLARPQNVVLGILPLWYWIDTGPWRRCFDRHARSVDERRVVVLWHELGPHLGRALALVAALVLAFGLQPYQWWSSYGELFMVPQGDYYLRLREPHIANLLFSSANGLFVWCPIVYVAVAGLVLRARREGASGLAWPLLLVLAISTYLNASVADWWGGVGFAARRYDAMTVPFALGIASALAEARRWIAARPRLAPAAFAGFSTIFLAGWAAAGSAGVSVGLRSDMAHATADNWTNIAARVQVGFANAVGNPLSWPASIPFAIRHGVHPRVWDHASTPELFFHRWLTLEAQADLTTADLVGVHSELCVGFDPPQGRFRQPSSDHARVLLPISYPYVGGLRLRVSGRPSGPTPVRLRLALDDEDLGVLDVPAGESVLDVPVARPHEGIVELSLAMEDGYVDLATIQLRDRDPSPAIAQARRNRRLRARRDAWRQAHGL